MVITHTIHAQDKEEKKKEKKSRNVRKSRNSDKSRENGIPVGTTQNSSSTCLFGQVSFHYVEKYLPEKKPLLAQREQNWEFSIER